MSARVHLSSKVPWLFACLVGCSTIWFASNGWGEVIARLPTLANKELPVTIEIEAIHAAPSVLPIHIQITRDASAGNNQGTDEIELTVRCKMRSMRSDYQGADMDATFDFKLAGNEASQGRWVFIPYILGEVPLIKFDVLVDGYAVNQFETNPITLPASHYDMAILTREDPIRPMTPVILTELAVASARNTRPRPDRQDAYILTPDRYFEDWQGYLAFQGVLIDAAILKELQAEKSKSWEALHKWVIAGGTLGIYGDRGFKLLMQQFGNATPMSDDPLKNSPLNPAMYSPRLQTSLGSNFPEFTREAPDQEALNAFRMTPYGGGHVVACELGDLKQLSWKHWALLMPPSARDDLRVFDVTTDTQRIRFSTSINQKLSGTPVYSFWGLITLFVALVGPLLYLFLKRAKTMYRVYLFVPPIAFLLSLATLATVSIVEGKRPREAVVRLTHVDSGRSMTELTTETIMSPQREQQTLVTHSPDQYVLPTGVVPAIYDARPYERFGIRSEDRWTIFDRQGKVFYGDQNAAGLWTGNLFGTREQRFYVSLEPRLSQASLQVISEPTMQVTNGLDVNFDELLIRDAGGRFWQVFDAEAGSTKSIEEVPQFEAVKIMRSIADQLPLVRDEGLSFSVGRIIGVPVFTTRGRRSGNPQQRGIDTGIPIERRLNEWRMGRCLWGRFWVGVRKPWRGWCFRAVK